MNNHAENPSNVQTLNRLRTKDFLHHAPKDDQVERCEFLRECGMLFASYVVKETLPSREQSLALTKIEEAVFWANAAIARNE